MSPDVYAPRHDIQPAIVAGPFQDSVLMQWMNHVDVRQAIYPTDDLMAKAIQLKTLLGHLRPDRRSSDVSLHFKSFSQGDWYRYAGRRPMTNSTFKTPGWQRAARREAVWNEYVEFLARPDLGQSPEVVVWDAKRHEPFEDLARGIGGKLNNPDFVHL
ncbi:uncharacterized protein RCC_05038 [Ramularia collo-cygni]|uniref:Uncharacterized protein n=1 Tax=Ramularia collo-cygni TaxID=112498 RepID=A0A2D3UQK3_9PEZI|nr:uncharacterized protein RCC_05038 [Ramularia collo-cygni]CZT19192.1 uncharacterized protein RCC_05038 [Ramularia collo-cygni]